MISLGEILCEFGIHIKYVIGTEEVGRSYKKTKSCSCGKKEEYMQNGETLNDGDGFI